MRPAQLAIRWKTDHDNFWKRRDGMVGAVKPYGESPMTRVRCLMSDHSLALAATKDSVRGDRCGVAGGCPASHEAGYGRGTGRSEARWGGCPASQLAGNGVRGR